MRRHRVAAVAAVMLVTAAADADAARQSAQFDVHIRGTQVSTWRYLDPADPNDPCDVGTEGNGDQTIAFETREPLPLRAWRRGNRRHGWSRTYLELENAFVDARADRQGELRALGTAPADCDPYAVGGGEGACENCEPEPPDCGRRDGRVEFWMSFHERQEDGDLAPLVRPPRNQLQVAAQSGGWHGGELASLGTGAPLTGTYSHCEFWIGGPYAPAEEDGGLIGALERVKEKRLLDRRTRRIVIHGSATRCYGEAGPVRCGSATGRFAGRTVLAFRLTLARR